MWFQRAPYARIYILIKFLFRDPCTHGICICSSIGNTQNKVIYSILMLRLWPMPRFTVIMFTVAFWFTLFFSVDHEMAHTSCNHSSAVLHSMSHICLTCAKYPIGSNSLWEGHDIFSGAIPYCIGLLDDGFSFLSL